MNCKRMIGVLFAIVLAVLILGPSGYAQRLNRLAALKGR